MTLFNFFQPEGGLPKPVIYVEPKDDDDEIKTNPDLFSDTNSNRGSQAGLDEGIYPIPDSASEASVDFRQGSQPLHAQPKLYQPRFNKRVTEVRFVHKYIQNVHLSVLLKR